MTPWIGMNWMRINWVGLLLLCWANLSLQGQNCSVNLGQDTSLCAASFTIQPAISVAQFEDSLEIIYDATQGQTGLVGASKVYFHSGAELVPFGGWQYPIGNWGQDDGIGEMMPLGNNRWRIVILPYQYYGFAQNTALNGIFMVFRNADGSATGKDGSGNDIWLDMGQIPPSSAFTGLQAAWITDALDSLLWSDGSSGNNLTVNGPGTYWLQMWDTAGCFASDTIQISLGTIPEIDLGQPVICDGNPAILDAGTGFVQYQWSTGATSQSISITSPALIFVTVTNAQGCQGIDVVNVPTGSAPLSNFTATPFGVVGVNFVDNSLGGGDYEWDFDGDGQTDDTTPGNVTHYFSTQGSYTCRLILTNFCGADTSFQSFTVGGIGFEDGLYGQFKLFPNPARNSLFLDLQLEKAKELSWKVIDQQGRTVAFGTEGKISGKFRKEFEIESLSDGIYNLVLNFGNQAVSKSFLKQ